MCIIGPSLNSLWSLIYPSVDTGPSGHSRFLENILPKPVISSDVLGSLHSQTRASKYPRWYFSLQSQAPIVSEAHLTYTGQLWVLMSLSELFM